MSENNERNKITTEESVDYSVDTTFGQRVADSVAKFGGSWKFIGLFGFILVGWICVNSLAFFKVFQFDPYPFILLNLMLSMIAALQAPIIMMSQNRQAEKDRESLQEDREVNRQAEIEIRNLRRQLTDLQKNHEEERRRDYEQSKLQTKLLKDIANHIKK